jgi:glycosyltransferase involved in cell wall biosynthesis
MRVVLFSHPSFLTSQSMPRYANMLSEGLKNRKHDVKIWTAKPLFYKIPFSKNIRKWLGYIDQFILFPLFVKIKLLTESKDTIFVFADQALGPWVPLVHKRPHAVHCHDFLALESALGLVPENPTSFTGKVYQKFIQKGFSKGNHFISVSNKTQKDLTKYHLGEIINSEVCYNGLNRIFERLDHHHSRKKMGDYLHLNLDSGYIMHIGGNQYYKNRMGVLEIYEQFRLNNPVSIPLLMIGSNPPDILMKKYQDSKFKEDIHFILNLGDQLINQAYSGATCLLFPSIDEGFGWPIAEAMASGCIVITTNTAPMNEVNGEANDYSIPRKSPNIPAKEWAEICAKNVSKVVYLPENEREEIIKKGLESSRRFDSKKCLDNITLIYNNIISNSIF